MYVAGKMKQRSARLPITLVQILLEFSLTVGCDTHFPAFWHQTNAYIRRCNVCNIRIPFGHQITLSCCGRCAGVYTYQLSPYGRALKIHSAFHTKA
ncbi:hypothetical protein V1508DRAFT_425790 [Lipomyces doorenjongii]|uniref:uncharacterized protein n=1 Tax=Lipomyces doorenjongii TaxID=383834 RepID=UPI0034CFB333